MSEEIAALRVEGAQAYFLYHGNYKVDYAIPMEKEVGKWKVSNIVTIELSRAKPSPNSTAGAKQKKKG